MALPYKVGGSLLLVVAVVWWMWRLPRASDALLGWGPALALFSTWTGLMAVVSSFALWVVPSPDRWLPAILMLLDPACCAAGVLVLWLYRGYEGQEATVSYQRLQAKVGIGLGIAAIAVGYLYVMTHKTPFTMIGQ